MSTKNVYFVLCPIMNRVKIGSAFDVRARLSSLQIGSPTPLTLVGSIAGTPELEASLHRDLRAWRTHGEWFDYSEHVRGVIDGLLSKEGPRKGPVPISDFDTFIEAKVCEGEGVPAREMYRAYETWCEASGCKKVTETRFGRLMKKKLVRDDSRRVHLYVGVALRDTKGIAA